jgi:hypothetical protein
VTENHFDSGGDKIVESLNQFDLKIKHSIIKDSNRDFTSLYIRALQLAIDEKIYRAGYLASDYGSNRLSVINNPELDGTNCNYIQNAIDLKTGIVKQGLPPFITSLFYTHSNTSLIGRLSPFFITTVETVDSVLWDFGDGTTSTDVDAMFTKTLVTIPLL